METRQYEAWERSGALRRRPGQRQAALHDHDAAAERDRQPAYGARADLHVAGHPDPLRADARPRRAVAARHRPCRHRHRDRRLQPARRAADRQARARPRRIHRARLGMEGRVGRHDHPPAAPARRLARLEPRALHDGCRAVGGGAPRLRHALPRRADLSRQAARQLGPGDAHGDLRSRSRQSRDAGARCGTSATRSRASRAAIIVVATTRPETMLGDTGVAVHPDDPRYRRSGRKEGAAAAGRPADPDRRRRIRRPGDGQRRRQDHAGARFQRFRGRPAARAGADQHLRPRRAI